MLLITKGLKAKKITKSQYHLTIYHCSLFLHYSLHKNLNIPANKNVLKWTEMNLSCSYQIQILIFLIHFYPIKVSEFFQIHFNPYERIKTKRFLFFSIKKKYADH